MILLFLIMKKMKNKFQNQNSVNTEKGLLFKAFK